MKTVLCTAPKKTFNHIYETYFKGKIENLYVKRWAAMSYKESLKSSQQKHLKRKQLTKMLPTIKELTKNPRVAVLKKLSESCQKHRFTTS